MARRGDEKIDNMVISATIESGAAERVNAPPLLTATTCEEAVLAKKYRSLTDYIEQWSMPEPNSGCWLWLGGLFQNGYACGFWESKTQKASRLSYRAHKGPIPPGEFVCHRCDVRSCVNPDHLWLGDHQANMDDMAEKGRLSVGALHSAAIKAVIAGRARRGSAHYAAKLTEEAVRLILVDHRSHTDIAAEHGVSRPVISLIKAGKRWAHIRA